MYTITIFPENRKLPVPEGQNLMDSLQRKGIYLDAPCGGNGKCGKCSMIVDGVEFLSYQTVVDRDMTVTLPRKAGLNVL